jgi:hypothetical protein
MDLEALGEYVKDKAWLIGIVLAVVGIILTLTAAIGLLWISAAVALGFMIIWPIRQVIRNWHLFSGPERYVQTGLNVVVLASLVWVLVIGLTTKGPAETFKNWGLIGIDVIVALGFIVLQREVPKWAQGRKKCPDCLNATDAAAKACSCGYHWPACRSESGSSSELEPG